MNISVIVEKATLTKKAGSALDKLISKRGNKPLLFLLSGGSSLELLDFVRDESFQPGLTFGMLDDRYSLDQSVNSFAGLRHNAFYLRAIRRGVVFLDSSVSELESLEEYSQRYEHEIQKWLKSNPNGLIRATVGVGPDGHTSGILPFPEDPKKFENLFNNEKLVVGYDANTKNLHRYRMTSTFNLMRKFDRVLIYMKGENKKEALRKVMAETGTLAETPARILRELPCVEIYTDISL